jgi:hypothetical protein
VYEGNNESVLERWIHLALARWPHSTAGHLRVRQNNLKIEISPKSLQMAQ